MLDVNEKELRSLHVEVSGSGRRAERACTARESRPARQRPRHSVGIEQPGRRRLRSQVAAGEGALRRAGYTLALSYARARRASSVTRGARSLSAS